MCPHLWLCLEIGQRIDTDSGGSKPTRPERTLHETRPEIPAGGPVSGWWAYLEERTHREVDAHVLRDRQLSAVRSAWEALRPLGVGLACTRPSG